MAINNHTVRNSDPIPTHYEDCAENCHDVAGQRFSIGGRTIHIGGNNLCGYANTVRSLCAVNVGGTIVVPAQPLDANALAVMAHYGIALDEVAPGMYRAAMTPRFESYYRVAYGRARGGGY